MNSIEERLTAVETELADVKRQLSHQRSGVVGRTQPDFLDTMFGIYASSPLFAEVTRNLEAEREREREEARQQGAADTAE